MSSAICFNLDKSKVLSYGNGLMKTMENKANNSYGTFVSFSTERQFHEQHIPWHIPLYSNIWLPLSPQGSRLYNESFYTYQTTCSYPPESVQEIKLLKVLTDQQI